MSVLVSTVEAFGYTEVEQAVVLSVQPAVALERTSSASESGSIDPLTGQNSGISASFSIEVNGTDENYDFIVGSTITTLEGSASAFTKDGSLIFANTSSLPSSTAVEDARNHGSDNRNVIVYPVGSMTITSPMTIQFEPGNATYGNCYKVKVNNASEGTLNQTIGTSAVPGTYNMAQDEAGSYQVTVFFTAVSK